ncbi:dipeptidyl peptidase III [Cadophora sp. DSE1049]|nr:dipeptidyl peptidase III [Cadophora sp. DSE1049]
MASPIHQLSIGAAFETLSDQEKLYAHYMSRAAWHGTRIILRQVSPESEGIFNLLMEIHSLISGDWSILHEDCDLPSSEIDQFLEYGSKFLSNIGNYYGSGDQKFVPLVPATFFQRLVSKSPKLQQLYSQVAEPMLSVPPFSLGYPGELTQSAYYPGTHRMSKDEIEIVSRALEGRLLLPENTRVRKTMSGIEPVFEVLQASVNADESPEEFALSGKRGIVPSFRTGSLEDYRNSQCTWITDTKPNVENIFGFVEPYSDPHGIRAEFEGLVAISNPDETKMLTKLVEHSATFIRRLPWATTSSQENGGKGPFEKALFEPPDFSSIHALAYCSSIIFPGINLPNYNDIRQECGFKNVIIANRMSAESNSANLSPFVDPNEVETFQKHKYSTYYWWVVLHELLGHGTGKMLIEEADGKFNFDIENRPIDSLSGMPIASWYKPAQTWTSQFGDLATTVDECRAELVGAYLMDDPQLLALFGFTSTSDITAEDITYNTYLQLGVDGLRGLQNFNVQEKRWGQAHSRAHFATLKCLLLDGDGFMTVDYDAADEKLIVRIDRNKIVSHGKKALGRMLLRLHMYRCTADVEACRSYYEDLSRVDGEYLEWRKIVLAKQQPKWLFVQANTFFDGNSVVLKEYEPTAEGIFQSWAERCV